jgi:hypothetical protein
MPYLDWLSPERMYLKAVYDLSLVDLIRKLGILEISPPRIPWLHKPVRLTSSSKCFQSQTCRIHLLEDKNKGVFRCMQVFSQTLATKIENSNHEHTKP